MVKKTAYKILDNLLLGKGVKKAFTGNSVRIPTRYFRYFPEDYEQDNIAFINQQIKEGMTTLDIGAHIGLLTAIMGKHAGETGKVYAFEPTPSSFEVLQKTIAINGLEKTVFPHPHAVCDKVGTATFHVSPVEANNANSLGTHTGQEGVQVATTSIDAFASKHQLKSVDFIKIDAEGAEYSVLAGAEKVIAQYKPIMILALHPHAIEAAGNTLQQIWELINKAGYKVQYKNNPINQQEFTSKEGLFDVFLLPQQPNS